MHGKVYVSVGCNTVKKKRKKKRGNALIQRDRNKNREQGSGGKSQVGIRGSEGGEGGGALSVK